MRKLYRSEENKIFAGILGGLGEHFDVDPVLLRLGWLLVVVMTGVIPGLIVYIIAAFVVPRRGKKSHADYEVKEGEKKEEGQKKEGGGANV